MDTSNATEPLIFLCDLETLYDDDDHGDTGTLLTPTNEVYPAWMDDDDVPPTEPLDLSGESPTYYLADLMTGEGAVRMSHVLRRFPLDHFDTIVLSFERVSSLDATGLAVMVRLYSQLVTSGRTLILKDVPPEIGQQLATVGVNALFGEPKKEGFLRPITGKLRALGRKKPLSEAT